MSDLLERRKVYSFETYAPAILSTIFQSVTVTSILDEETARKSIPTHELHAALYRYLPKGTPNDPTAYDYYQLKTADGQTVVIGEPWIKADSVELIDAVTYMVKIAGQGAGDYNRIRNALLGSNIKTFEITAL